MTGIKLTLDQKNNIHGKNFTDVLKFNCVQDINNDWFLFLSDSDKLEIESTQYVYLLSLQEFEYVAPIIENPFI